MLNRFLLKIKWFNTEGKKNVGKEEKSHSKLCEEEKEPEILNAPSRVSASKWDPNDLMGSDHKSAHQGLGASHRWAE